MTSNISACYIYNFLELSLLQSHLIHAHLTSAMRHRHISFQSCIVLCYCCALQTEKKPSLHYVLCLNVLISSPFL